MLARQADRNRKLEGETVMPPPPRKRMWKLLDEPEVSRHDHGTGGISSSSVQRPLSNQVGILQKASGVRETVSAAALFQKKPKIGTNGQKHRRPRHAPPELDLAGKFRGIINPPPMTLQTKNIPEGIESAHGVISLNLETSFANVHELFMQRLATSRSADDSFFESVSGSMATISEPLVNEQVETTFTRNGRRVTEIVQIGKRVLQFKKSVEKEEAKLREYWKQWEEVQREYVELGIEVFGKGASRDKEGETGFKREMELLDLEHQARVGEFTEEIDVMAMKTIQRMKASERDLDATSKREQARLLQVIMEN